MTFTVNRRQALAIGAGTVAATMLGWSTLPALAESNGFEEVINKFTGGQTPAEGRVNLDLPQIADDGNSVPLTITVDSPMSEESHVTDVLVVADGNPRPGVATFHFSPASGAAEVSIHIRLLQTENVIAVAKMNDGSVFMAKKAVTVTVGGCGAVA
jgi:sulfur-oxidizing protein SoxY